MPAEGEMQLIQFVKLGGVLEGPLEPHDDALVTRGVPAIALVVSDDVLAWSTANWDRFQN